MRFADIHKGKKYVKTLANNHDNNRKGEPKEKIFYTLLVVDKDEDKNEICASVIPPVGKPTAPTWYPKSQFERWKPLK